MSDLRRKELLEDPEIKRLKEKGITSSKIDKIFEECSFEKDCILRKLKNLINESSKENHLKISDEEIQARFLKENAESICLKILEADNKKQEINNSTPAIKCTS